MALMVFLIIFASTFAFGYPIAFGMLAGGIVYFIVKGLSLANLLDMLVINLSNQTILIAVPLFVLAANIMNDTEITTRLFDFVRKSFGRVRGSLGYANIVASIIFAGMSGSQLADVAGLGNIEIKAMKDAGYDGPFSCAVTAASATIGPIIPPSIPMVLYSMLSGASLGYLFLAGFLPGLLLAGLEMLMVYVLSVVRKYPVGDKVSLRVLSKSFLSALPALLAPVILLVGLYTGIYTPTEAAAVVVVYSIIVSFLIYKTLGLKKLYKILVKSAQDVGYISIMVAAAQIVSYIVTREKVAVALTEFFTGTGLVSNRILLLASINVLYFVLGMFIDASVTILVVIPMLLPLVKAAGIDLVHFGVMSVLNIMIGLDTPPYAQTGFITSAIGGVPVKEVFKEMFKFWIPIEVLCLVLVTYFPEISLFLPRLFGYKG
ncbi:TRAP transporter large permease [Pseudothermotoga sp. U03pept]|uniref:TRAP transporter large permease n=1 Tax=Pseudothermotoga sp. U03pept TaxID=3447012 RepID=UPI003F01BFD8